MTFLGVSIDRLLRPRRAFESRVADCKMRVDARAAEAQARAHKLREQAAELDEQARAAIAAAEARAATLQEEAAELRESRRLGPRGVEDVAKAGALEDEARSLVAAAVEAPSPEAEKARGLRAEADKLELEAKAAADRDEADFALAEEKLKISMRAQGAKQLLPALTEHVRLLSKASALALIDACEAVDARMRGELGATSDSMLGHCLTTAGMELAGIEIAKVEQRQAANGVYYTPEPTDPDPTLTDLSRGLAHVLKDDFSIHRSMRILLELAEHVERRRAANGLAPL